MFILRILRFYSYYLINFYGMLVSTTNFIDGRKAREYLGIVGGEAILGANIFRDWKAGITDKIGGRSGTYERQLRSAKSIAIKEMTEMAQEIGGNAVLGASLHYQSVSAKSTSMLMVAVSGTAVILEPTKEERLADIKEKLARGEITKEQYYEMKTA